MPRRVGETLSRSLRRRAIRQLQSLVAAGISDEEAKAQVGETFNVTERTTRNWMATAYAEMAAEARVDREKLLGAALRRRRIAMARAMKDGDVRTYLAAADSEAKLLGLNAPVQTEHHVVLTKVQDMSRAVVEVVRDFFADDPVQRAKFVQALRARLNAQLAERPEKLPLVIEAGEPEPVADEAGDEVEALAAADVRAVEPTNEAPADEGV
ncbi:MAG: hypothetical protein JNL90_10640 [Planctomycetes bacterium]|nr:hypothetical protein [Planctomycetota bacterium]